MEADVILQLTSPSKQRLIIHMRHVKFIREREAPSIGSSIGLGDGVELYVTEPIDDILSQIPADWGR